MADKIKLNQEKIVKYLEFETWKVDLFREPYEDLSDD